MNKLILTLGIVLVVFMTSNAQTYIGESPTKFYVINEGDTVYSTLGSDGSIYVSYMYYGRIQSKKKIQALSDKATINSRLKQARFDAEELSNRLNVLTADSARMEKILNLYE